MVNYFYDKITRNKIKRGVEKKTIKKFMELNEDKNIIIDITWANKYTLYLINKVE